MFEGFSVACGGAPSIKKNGYGFFKRPLEILKKQEEILACAAHYCFAAARYSHRHRWRISPCSFYLYSFLIFHEEGKAS